MRLVIIAVGNRMPAWVDAGFNEYAKRMPREARVELIEIKPCKRGAGKNTGQILAAERDCVSAAIPRNSLIIALDERGKGLTTAELAGKFTGWLDGGRDVSFVVGGADGLHQDIKDRAHELLALSAMTLPHGLVRVLLAEQLYRAISIIRHHPDHRE